MQTPDSDDFRPYDNEFTDPFIESRNKPFVFPAPSATREFPEDTRSDAEIWADFYKNGFQ